MFKKKKFKESETLELKKSTSELKEAVISIVAILNKHEKGELYFGIKNNGSIIGQDVSEKTLREISRCIADNIEPKIYPKIQEIKINNKNCVYVEFKGNNSPYFAYGRAFVRVGDENKGLSAKELENMILRKNKPYWDSGKSDIKLSKINEKLLKDYVQRGRGAGRITFSYENKENTLKKIGLMKKGYIVKAAELLFCDENSLEIQAAVFAGKDKTTFLDIKVFKGNIFNMLKQMESYITEKINWRVEFKDFKRAEIPEVPINAIRETLVNSLCHRDYIKPEANKISIYNNRIEIWNPGKFPEGFTPEDFIKGKEESVLRNPLIAGILYYSKDIEKWGSGLKRIYDECKLNKVKVELKNTIEGFKVVFYRDLKLVPENVPENVPERFKQILRIISWNKNITVESIAKQLNVSDKTIKRDISKLKKKKILKRIGSAKGGYWEIIKGGRR